MALRDEDLGEDFPGGEPEERARRNGPVPKGWPKKLPDPGADLRAIRGWLNQAAQLPAGWTIDLVTRLTRYGSDPMTVTLRPPGQTKSVDFEFTSARDASKPQTLRAAFNEATDGACRMKHPTPGQAGDFYGMLCALARVASTATIADFTRDWLEEYIERGTGLTGLTLHPIGRLDALLAIQNRNEFTKLEAQRYVRGDLDSANRWVVVLDEHTEELYLRTGELACWHRHVRGESIAQHLLTARLVEVGAEYVRVEEDRRQRPNMEGQRVGRHVNLTFYRFPSFQAFPSATRMHRVSGS